MKKIKMNNLFWGTIICASYLAWLIIWKLKVLFISGEWNFRPAMNLQYELVRPGSEFIFGTDIYGRSQFEVLSEGLSYSLSMGVIVSFCAAAIGLVIGYLTIKAPAILTKLLDLFTNVIFIFPSILIAILFMSVWGESVIGLAITLIFTGWPAYARITRGEAKRILALSYVESAKAIGVSEWRLFFKVVLPALLPFIIIHFALGVSGVIISEATLGFLGLGGSEYSWGALLAIGKSVLLEAPHVVIIISVFLALLIIGLNLLGDGLRDYLDPYKERG